MSDRPTLPDGSTLAWRHDRDDVLVAHGHCAGKLYAAALRRSDGAFWMEPFDHDHDAERAEFWCAMMLRDTPSPDEQHDSGWALEQIWAERSVRRSSWTHERTVRLHNGGLTWRSRNGYGKLVDWTSIDVSEDDLFGRDWTLAE